MFACYFLLLMFVCLFVCFFFCLVLFFLYCFVLFLTFKVVLSPRAGARSNLSNFYCVGTYYFAMGMAQLD